MAYSTQSSPHTKTSASIDFFKYQGAGNDFILIEEQGIDLDIPFLCNRHYGIGGDGVILLEPSKVADVKMRFFNPDGSEAGLCGNGLRCVVRHLGRSSTVETMAGVLSGAITETMISATIPYEILDEGLVWTGTQHYVVFADDFSEFETKAPLLRKRHNANVNFAILGELVQIRTFEKGVEGETLACGTGAAAVAALLKKNVTIVHRSLDKTKFTWDTEGRLWMEGPAEFVFAGKIPTRVKSLAKWEIGS